MDCNKTYLGSEQWSFLPSSSAMRTSDRRLTTSWHKISLPTASQVSTHRNSTTTLAKRLTQCAVNKQTLCKSSCHNAQQTVHQDQQSQWQQVYRQTTSPLSYTYTTLTPVRTIVRSCQNTISFEKQAVFKTYASNIILFKHPQQSSSNTFFSIHTSFWWRLSKPVRKPYTFDLQKQQKSVISHNHSYLSCQYTYKRQLVRQIWQLRWSGRGRNMLWEECYVKIKCKMFKDISK